MTYRSATLPALASPRRRRAIVGPLLATKHPGTAPRLPATRRGAPCARSVVWSADPRRRDTADRTGRRPAPPVGAVQSKLDDVEAGDAVGANAAQFAVEIGLARAERRDGRSDRLH